MTKLKVNRRLKAARFDVKIPEHTCIFQHLSNGNEKFPERYFPDVTETEFMTLSSSLSAAAGAGAGAAAARRMMINEM